jgi:hypothetical protein
MSKKGSKKRIVDSDEGDEGSKHNGVIKQENPVETSGDTRRG